MEWGRGWTREGKERQWGRKVDKARERKGGQKKGKKWSGVGG